MSAPQADQPTLRRKQALLKLRHAGLSGRLAAGTEEPHLQAITAKICDELIGIQAVGLTPDHAAVAAKGGRWANFESEHGAECEVPSICLVRGEIVRATSVFSGPAGNKFGAAAERAFGRGGHGRNCNAGRKDWRMFDARKLRMCAKEHCGRGNTFDNIPTGLYSCFEK